MAMKAGCEKRVTFGMLQLVRFDPVPAWSSGETGPGGRVRCSGNSFAFEREP
jgi:hypothetical protein